MPRFAPLFLMLMVAIPASTATRVFADPRSYERGDDYHGGNGTYGYQDDDGDGPSDLYGQYGGSDGSDDDDSGAYGPDDEFSPDDPSDGMRT
jgi:hypothetical protein